MGAVTRVGDPPFRLGFVSRRRPAMSRLKLLVTGASGHLGKRVVRLLLASGTVSLIATTRRPEALAAFAAQGVEVRKANFDDETGLEQAFMGADRVLLISTDR